MKQLIPMLILFDIILVFFFGVYIFNRFQYFKMMVVKYWIFTAICGAEEIVILKDGRKVNVKDYIGSGLYQGNNILTKENVYFDKLDVKAICIKKH